MAIEVRQRTCIVPANTSQAAPQVFDLSMPQRRVDTLELMIPSGAGGLVGFFLSVGNARAIPYDAGEWIVTAAEKISWPLEGYPTSGAWTLTAYNTGTQPHGLYVRFLVSLPSATVASRPAMLDDADLVFGDQVDTTDPGAVILG